MQIIRYLNNLNAYDISKSIRDLETNTKFTKYERDT